MQNHYKNSMSDWSVKAMTIDVFWQRIESAIYDYGECVVCPVNEYAHETNTVPMCDRVCDCDCADGLMKLHKKLQDEERQKMERDSDGRE